MNLGNLLDSIWGDDTGSALVDWLVLTSGTLMLAIAVLAAVSGLATAPAADASGATAETAANV